MAKAYQYDASGYFVDEVEDYGLLPNNATYTAPPDGPWERIWPCWTGEAWELIEDHRERKPPYFAEEFTQDATEYWLPADGDDWQSQPRTMKEPGPLPVGAVLVQPEKPLAVAQDEKRREIDAGYEAALIAALTMPLASPTPMTVSMETAALLAVDPDGLDSIKDVLAVRRAELLVLVAEAQTLDAVQAIAVSYPV